MSVSVPPAQLLTREDVALYLRVSEQTVSQWVHAGALQCYRLGPRNWRFSAAQVETFLSQRLVGSSQVDESPKKKRQYKDTERMERTERTEKAAGVENSKKENPKGKSPVNLLERIRSCR